MKSKVTIVGAGMGGLVLAASLLRQGIEVEVLEQAERFSRVGTGIGCTPNAVQVLWGLGLRERLDEIGFEAEYKVSRTWDTGEVMHRVQQIGYFTENFGAPRLLFHRGDLHEALWRLVPDNVIRYGTKVERATAHDEGVVLHFADGSEELCDAVVAADGVHSPIRESLLGNIDARYTGKVAYRSVFPIELLHQPINDPDTKWWGPDRHIVVYFVSNGREVYFTTNVPDAEMSKESFSAEGDLDVLREEFAGFHQELRAVLDACPKTQKWAIFEREPLPAWQAGRAVLLGDACHPMTPFMQQGAATAMEDAVVLSRCIAAGGSIEDAFSQYEALRKPRTSVIQRESHQNNWNKTKTGNDQLSPEWVYCYDAWTTPLDAIPVAN